VEASTGFVNCLLEFQARRRPKTAAAGQTERPQPESMSPSRLSALKVLGLEHDATSDEISRAHRRLAQMYHPDKVAGLAPELHDVAERRMKEINAAYELLKHPA